MAARARLRAALERAGVKEDRFEDALRRVIESARIDVHFHPERVARDGRRVIEGLLAEGVWRTQYETGISSGSTTAYPGGERDRWEARLFGGAYHAADVAHADRPRYGALEVLAHPDGASPRFGSCFFVLREEVARRSTFTWGGSQEDAALERSGTRDEMAPVLAAIAHEIEANGGAFGVEKMTLAELVARLEAEASAGGDADSRPLGRALDSFVEAQIHGAIDLRNDVRELVADPSFRGDAIGARMEALAEAFGWPLRWHPGYVLPLAEVPAAFRGYEIAGLAKRIAAFAGVAAIDAAVIGEAAAVAEKDLEGWSPGDSLDELRTRFRRLWHALVVLGRARGAR